MKFSSALLGLLTAIGVPASYGTEPRDACRADLLKAAPTSRHAYKRRGNYCEGVISQPISGSFVAVGFTVGVSPNSSAAILAIVVPSFVTTPKTELKLLGTNGLLGVPYRLDANFPASGIIKWSIDAVAKPLKLSAAEIGLIAVWQRELVDVLVPVAYESDVKATLGLTANLKVRVPEELTSVEFRLRGSQSTAWQPITEGTVYQGQLLDVPIPITAIVGGAKVDIRGDTPEQPATRVTKSFNVGNSGR